MRTHIITQTDVALVRQKSKLSQRQFADTLGISVRTLGKPGTKCNYAILSYIVCCIDILIGE